MTSRATALVIAVGMIVALFIVPPLAVLPLGAAPALLSTSAIRVGMTGIGKTVVIGTRVAEFQVRVLGILKNGGPAGDLILFRASGPAIESVGGLAAGMSGSPIYLGGRLAGAFSYALQATDPMIGLFTPISDMLKDLPPRANACVLCAPVAVRAPRTYAVTPFSLGGRTIRWITVAGPVRSARPAGRSALVAESAERASRSDTLVAVPAATPLFVSGLGLTEREALVRFFEPMGVVPIEGSAPISLPASLPLEPGSAISVGLMQGDISAHAMGTLTYRDGNRILAFGHPFMDFGHASYLLTNAMIFQTIRGQQRNVKIGAAGAVVGMISEDRPAGIGGTIGALPRLFGVRIRVTDADTGTSRRFTFQVVATKQIAPMLAMLGAQEAIERALNRSGEGTAQVRMVLRGRTLPHPVERENLFYSGDGIALRALTEVPQAMHLLFDNDFADVGPTDMEMEVRVTGQQETAVITDAEMPTSPVAPGSTLHVKVTLRPFRGSPQTRDVALTVPADFPSGPALLVVRAGGALPPSSLLSIVLPQALSPGPTPRTLPEAIKTFEQGERNTDVVIELTGGAQRPPSAAISGASGVVAPPSSTETTPWVLRGRFQAPIMVEGGTR